MSAASATRINIGLYAPADMPAPTLLFESNEAGARDARKLIAPEGTVLQVQSSPAD